MLQTLYSKRQKHPFLPLELPPREGHPVKHRLKPEKISSSILIVGSGPVWRQDLAILSPEGPRDSTCQLRECLFALFSSHVSPPKVCYNAWGASSSQRQDVIHHHRWREKLLRTLRPSQRQWCIKFLAYAMGGGCFLFHWC